MSRRSRWVVGFQLLGLGWFVSAAIVAGVIVGLLLDGWAGSSPAFLLLGLLLGLSVAFYGAYRMVYGFLMGQPGLDGSSGTNLEEE